MIGARAQYGTIVVVGGGCYGTFYVRQLGRAARAGVLGWDRIVVIDRNPDCGITQTELLVDSPGGFPEPHLVVSEWMAFFADYLSRWASASDSTGTDAIVPSPLMPHLMYDWLRDRARARWPGRAVDTRPLSEPPPVPWQRASPDGTHYVSFAEWICPVNCIEPERCPHTRGPRTWTMPRAVSGFVDAERGRGRNIDGPLIFHCTHRAYGVGMIDTALVVAADQAVSKYAADGAAEILVGTVSHCHGALNILAIS